MTPSGVVGGKETALLIHLTIFLIGATLGIAGGLYIGVKLAHRQMEWRIRMHFYAQGMNHKAVDKHMAVVLHNPGFPDGTSWDRLKAQRTAEGLRI